MIPDGWERKRLSNFIKKLNAGVSVNSENTASENSQPAVLKTSCVSNGVFDPMENKIVIKDDEIARLKESVKKERIIISRMNTPFLVGANAYTKQDYPNLFLPDRLWQVEPKNKNVCMRWLAFVLGSSKGRFALSSRATGTSGSMKNITKSDVLSLEIETPPLPEQQLIAEILSTWDKAIEATEKLIANSEAQKKALMQQLLTGKKRLPGFEGEWSATKFDELFEIVIGGTPSRKNNEYWASDNQNGFPWIAISDLKKKYISETKEAITILGVNNSNVKLLKAGTIILSFKLSIGKKAILETDAYTNEAICGLVPKKENEIEKHFVFHMLEYMDLEQSVDQAIKGKTLNKAKLKKLFLPHPSFEEQKAISISIEATDKYLEATKSNLTHLKSEKKALMQQLLTGKRRVKIEEEDKNA